MTSAELNEMEIANLNSYIEHMQEVLSDDDFRRLMCGFEVGFKMALRLAMQNEIRFSGRTLLTQLAP